MKRDDITTYFSWIVSVCGGISAIISLVVLICKPIRNKVLNYNQIINGQKCLLRTDMLRIYFANHEKNEISKYEKENFLYEYEAYKALDGNSFIDDIYNDIRKWEVIS